MKNTYEPGEIEPRWQASWAEHRVYRTPNPGDADFDPDKAKEYYRRVNERMGEVIAATIERWDAAKIFR